MIYLIAVPHQMPAKLLDFQNEDAIIDYANAISDESYENAEDAKDYLVHDYNTGIWIYSGQDLSYAQHYSGHQAYKVLALLNDIDEDLLS